MTRTGWNARRTARAKSVVEPERGVAVDELGDVAGEDGDEERGRRPPERDAVPGQQHERCSESDLDQPREHHDEVGIERDPVRHLGEEIRSGPREVSDPGEDEPQPEDDADQPPGADGHGAAQTRPEGWGARTTLVPSRVPASRHRSRWAA